jgi:ABC-type sugar transport system ATPase subunit
MSAIELQGISKAYKRKPVLSDVNLAIESGTFTVIFGGPGSGKSILQRLIVGLEKPDSGRVLLRGRDATGVIPSARNIGYIPQSFALYPHYSVFENIAYPLTLAGASRDDAKPVVGQAADLLKITHLLEKTPNQLSGGEKQRVAIARGIVKDTEIFIFDDPLTGLDFKLREQLFDDFRRLRDALNATFIYTTSDALETLMMADEIAVLAEGRITEHGPTQAIFDKPQHAWTMRSLGFPESTLFEGTLHNGSDGYECRTKLFNFAVDLKSEGTPPATVVVGIRPQDLSVNESLAPNWISTPASIILQEDLGGELALYLEKDGLSFESVLPHRKDHLLSGDEAVISVDPEKLVIFDPESGYRIGQGRV